MCATRDGVHRTFHTVRIMHVHVASRAAIWHAYETTNERLGVVRRRYGYTTVSCPEYDTVLTRSTRLYPFHPFHPSRTRSTRPQLFHPVPTRYMHICETYGWMCAWVCVSM